jgi:ketosteroid isomerase-like protein
MPFDKASKAEIADLVRRATQGNEAFMNGKMDEWLALTPHSSDFSLMSPFGGWSTNGFNATPERLASMSRYFASAKTELEVVATHATADMVVLAVVERQYGVVGDLPAQDWSLRVTLVYQRGGNGWELVHRHADPLVKAITLDQIATLADPVTAEVAGQA